MKTYAMIVFLTILSMVIWHSRYASDSSIYVRVFDVGQGDSILIDIPGDKTILVDGGPGDYVLVELGSALPPWVRTIDTIVLTHPHADHLEGLLDILERYDIQEIILNPICYDNASYEYLLDQVKDLEIEVVKIGVIGFISEMYGGVEIGYFTVYGGECGDGSFVSAMEGEECGECRLNLNNTSIVVAVSTDQGSVLLMGDAEVEVEQDIYKMVSSIMHRRTFEVLKAGHHCSRTASSEGFLEAVEPKVAICSLGEDNKFDHPHSETIDRFTAHAVPYLRTDIDGSITVEISPDGWRVIK
jgi:competence protein ComEC